MKQLLAHITFPFISDIVMGAVFVQFHAGGFMYLAQSIL